MTFPFPAKCPGTYGPGPLLVDPPAVVNWKYGLLSVADLPDENDVHARNGIAYKSMACVGDVQPWVDDCERPPVKAPTDTVAGEDNIVAGCPFHLYAALACKTTTLTEMAAEVAEVFRLGEQKAIETNVWAHTLATSNSTVLNVTSLPADAFTVVGGIAALEGAFADCYGGQATFHASRALAPYLQRDRQLVLNGEHYETALGSKFGFYGGAPNSSPAGVAAPVGYAWVYATSALTLRRMPIEILPDVEHRLVYTPGMLNEPYILAERTYIPSVECCMFATLVCLACS